MVQCAVSGCNSRSDVHNHGTDIHFHRIPRNPRMRNKWLQVLHKNSINESTRICSLHFGEQNYCRTKNGLKRLVSEAFPDTKLPPTPPPPEESSESSDDEQQAPNIVIVNQIPGNTLVSNMGQPGGTNIIVVPQSSTVRIEPQIVNQVLTPVNVVQNNPAAPYVQMQGQSVENPSGNVPNVPNEGNFENQIRTPLENQLMAEVKMLREAIDCLEEQNRLLLIRNNFLQQTLDNYERETGLVNNFDFNPDIFGV